MKSMLFIGNYPNPADKYRNVFFQNLIFAIADQKIRCTVISPISLTHYRSQIKLIPNEDVHYTKRGEQVKVYYPRCVTYSSKKIGILNTCRLSEKSFQRAALKMAKRIKTPFDCIYGHFFISGGLAATLIGRKLNIPAFIAYGECDYESQIQNPYGNLSHDEIEGLKGIISVSTDNCNELKQRKLFDNYPVLLAPNGVDLDSFYRMDKMECRKKLGIPDDVFVVGFVGGFIERKGDKRLLAAINQLHEVYGAFAGKGDIKPTGPRVVFCDALKHEDIPVFLNACDIFALPTLSEGSCNAIIEAMSCGLPIVSSNLPFNEDILNEDNSIRIDPSNIDEISHAIQELKDDKELRRKLSTGALETAKKLTIEERSNKIINFIETCIQKQ